MKHAMFLLASVTALSFSQTLAGQENGVLGYWREPHGSIIHVDVCGKNVCATLVDISATAPARIDGKNPDSKLRGRTLCGLRVGENFHLTSPAKAEDGNLYDPESGNTYHGVMTAHGDQMDLRGYIGLSIFGRTQQWNRTSPVKACTA